MDTLNTNKKIALLLSFFFLFSCQEKKSSTSLILTDFYKNIHIEGYTELELKTSNIKFIGKSINRNGKLTITKIEDSLYIGEINFHHLYDTIFKQDTVKLTIGGKKYFITEIVNRNLKKESFGIKSNFIEFVFGSKKYRGSEKVLIKKE